MHQITIGLLWHSLSSGNLGVGALTESNISIIRQVADLRSKKIRFIILGTGQQGLPELAQELQRDGHTLENYRVRVFRSEFREQVSQCDLIIDIGEGDSFADIYGFKRFFYYWLSKNVVLSLGKPLILAPQTIGPFNGTFARIMAVRVMRGCTKVFSRDKLSSDYLQELGITKNTDEAIDVAFKLPFNRNLLRSNGKFRVGLNVSGLLFNGGYTGKNQFNLIADYPELVRKILTWLANKHDTEIHLIPHVLSPNMPTEDDLAVSNRLAKEFPGTIVAPVFNRPSDAKSYIASMNFFCGARMHACIGAFSSGVPVLPMAYSRKFNGLFSSLNYPNIIDLTANSTNKAFSLFKTGFTESVNLKNSVTEGNKMAADKIQHYIQFLDDFLQSQKIQTH